MRITWLGHASFLIESGEKKLVTDPFDNIGLAFPRVSADVVATSHAHFDHNATNLVGGEFEVVSGTGEFSTGPFAIKGFASYHDESRGSERGDNTIYVIEVEGLRLCHLGDLGHALTADEVAALGRVDVLMIPVGGTYTIDAAGAREVAQAINPKIILPMHYKIEGLSLPIAPVSDFATAYENVRDADALEVSAGELPASVEVVILKRKS